nr:hypothetical protein [Tanacetum cinerariifolium]
SLRFAPVARIEAIRLFLAYASFMGFMVYQMDIKSAFLYETIEEEVYFCQPSGFEDPDYPDKIYVDDIIFSLTNKDLCKSFEKLMKNKFQLSSMGELTFFLGLHIKQKKDMIFISQDKYVAEILRKFRLTYTKSASTPIDTKKPLLKDPDGEDQCKKQTVMATSSTEAEYVAAASCCAQVIWIQNQLLDYGLISWQCKKQIVVATSSIEAEYVVAVSCCTLVLWIQNQLLDYGANDNWLKKNGIGVNAVDLQVSAVRPKLLLFSLTNWCCSLSAVSWLVQKQTALGKDKSNPFIVDSLLKTIWSSIHRLLINEILIIPGQTATGKEISNSFMAGVNAPRSDEDMLELMKLTVFLLPKVEKIGIGVNAVDLQVSAVRPKLLLFSLTNWCCSLSAVSSIKYALTVNPNIYVSCIKQFWTTVAIKQVNDVTRLQVLVYKKKVVVTEATIREALHLDDAEGVDCLPNEEIFAELARIGYEKPSTKLTFYKAFFSIQWKFLIHTILQCMSAKRTSWNEFSSSMASAVICLSSGRKFNFSKYIFDSLVRNVDSITKFYMYPLFLQLIIRKQVGDLLTHTTKYTSLALTQKVFANMRRVGKGFSKVEIPLFEGMLVEQQGDEEGDANKNVEKVNAGDAAEGDDSAAHGEVHTITEEQSIPSS